MSSDGPDDIKKARALEEGRRFAWVVADMFGEDRGRGIMSAALAVMLERIRSGGRRPPDRRPRDPSLPRAKPRGPVGRPAGPFLRPGTTIEVMVVACEYPNCREIATIRIVIELAALAGRSSIGIPLCDAHAEQAQSIARRHDGVAYRLRPI